MVYWFFILRLFLKKNKKNCRGGLSHPFGLGWFGHPRGPWGWFPIGQNLFFFFFSFLILAPKPNEGSRPPSCGSKVQPLLIFFFFLKGLKLEKKNEKNCVAMCLISMVPHVANVKIRQFWTEKINVATISVFSHSTCVYIYKKQKLRKQKIKFL
jgi:hypothetical protein